MSRKRAMALLVLWILLSLLAPSTLLHHAYRYYAMLALPAVCMLIMLGLVSVSRNRWWRVLIVALIAADIVVNIWFIEGHVSRGANDDIPALNNGYNHLIRKAARGQ